MKAAFVILGVLAVSACFGIGVKAGETGKSPVAVATGDRTAGPGPDKAALLDKVSGPKAHFNGPLELAETAEIIIVGTITAIDGQAASIKVEEIVRGVVERDSIQVAPIGVEHCLGTAVVVKSGDRVAAFLVASGETYTPVGRGDGIVVIRDVSLDEDLRALRLLAEISTIRDEDTKYRAIMAESSSRSTIMRRALREVVIGRISHASNRQNYKEPILNLLRSKDPELQRMALQGMQRIHAPEAIPLIIKAMQSDDLNLVESASQAIAQYDTKDTVDALIKLMSHSNERIRSRGCGDLRRSSRPEARTAIMRLMDDPSPRVRALAVASPVYWFREGKAREFIPVLIGKMRDPDEEVQQSAAQTLGESRDCAVVHPLLDVLRSGSFGERLEGGVLQALSMAYSDPEDKCRKAIDDSIRLVLESLERGHLVASRHAVDILGRSNAREAVPALREAAGSHPLPEIRDMAQRALDMRK